MVYQPYFYVFTFQKRQIWSDQIVAKSNKKQISKGFYKFI